MSNVCAHIGYSNTPHHALEGAKAADLAAAAGSDLTDGVTKRTTILVVGDQHIRRLAGASSFSAHTA